MKFFIEDVNIFYLTLYGGIAIGLIFDLYRALRSNFKIVRKISLVFDVIFWFLITIVIFTTINLLEKFDLRFFLDLLLYFAFDSNRYDMYDIISRHRQKISYMNDKKSYFEHMLIDLWKNERYQLVGNN